LQDSNLPREIPDGAWDDVSIVKNLTSRFLIGACLLSVATAAPTPHLLQQPSLSRTQIVFSYAGDLWIVPRSGGDATRLTTGVGIESNPVFSPDGSAVAFSGAYDGNIDVYTIPASGGIPKRITYHPDADFAVTWTPDGSRIVFTSTRDSHAGEAKLYSVAANGGLAEPLPMPLAHSGAFSPDGKRIVYTPTSGGSPFSFERYVAWKRYRGGRANSLRVIDLKTLDSEKIPRQDSNDFNPMWVGDKIYFLSDRDGKVTLYRYDPVKKAVGQLVRNTGFDIRSASAAAGGIVYDQFGELYLFDIASGRSNRVDVRITGDMPEVRAHFADVSREIRVAGISPTGARAVFEAHGEILTVPASHGDARDLTNTPGVMERQPVWSPDGQQIAYFSDESGEYALHLRSQSGAGETKKFSLAGGSTYYFNPVWSPDSKMLCYYDNKLNVWYLDTRTGKATKIAANEQKDIDHELSWSPDSKWIAYTKSLGNMFYQVLLYSIETGKSTAVTDGMSDAHYPVFDKDGQYLYFTASTNTGTMSGLDMTSDLYPVTRSIYAAVLSATAPSPVAPESDEEKSPAPKPAADASATPKPVTVHVDLAGLQNRIVALPMSAANYTRLQTGKAGKVYFLEASGNNRTVSVFELKTRHTEKLGENVRSFQVSFDGEKMLVEIAPPRGSEGAASNAGPQFAIVPASAPWKPGEGLLRLSGMQVKVDPPAEWKQMYHEVWRIERSHFYDPNYHGVDIDAREKVFEPYLNSIASRADLNYIFQEMLGDITVGHLRGAGGTIPTSRPVPGGLLGADFEIANGRYRITRIYTGELWNPQLRGPLAQPPAKVLTGDYILAVNGQDLAGTDDISRLLEGTSGKTVVLKLAIDPAGAGMREVSVVPVASEGPLRMAAWVEANRKKVDELSGGKLAYVYMNDTGIGGFTSFNRYFFAQTDKQGLVLDERFNHGGQAADYVIDVLRRPLMNYWAPRWGAIYRTPQGSIAGPKVMVTNEYAGSGGDAMPWYFREGKLGTLVGTRTWGGLVGISAVPALMDGASVTSPDFGFFSPSGEWDVENHGVAPDVVVEMDPKLVAQGHDPQLERAVAIAMEKLQKSPMAEPKKPRYPNYQTVTQQRTGHAESAGGSQ
jgi:tricorn protease